MFQLPEQFQRVYRWPLRYLGLIHPLLLHPQGLIRWEECPKDRRLAVLLLTESTYPNRRRLFTSRLINRLIIPILQAD